MVILKKIIFSHLERIVQYPEIHFFTWKSKIPTLEARSDKGVLVYKVTPVTMKPKSPLYAWSKTKQTVMIPPAGSKMAPRASRIPKKVNVHTTTAHSEPGVAAKTNLI
jgi:hypothetical protein